MKKIKESYVIEKSFRSVDGHQHEIKINVDINYEKKEFSIKPYYGSSDSFNFTEFDFKCVNTIDAYTSVLKDAYDLVYSKIKEL